MGMASNMEIPPTNIICQGDDEYPYTINKPVCLDTYPSSILINSSSNRQPAHKAATFTQAAPNNISPSAVDEYFQDTNGVWYKIISEEPDNNLVEITDDNNRNRSYSGSLSVPMTILYNGITYNVASIADNAFYGATSITTLDMRSASLMTSIGAYAFYGCNNITGIITIPDNVSYIGVNAFGETDNIDAFVFSGHTAPSIPSSIRAHGPSYYPRDAIGYDTETQNLPFPAYPYSNQPAFVAGPANQIGDEGQTISFTVTPSGGTSPYTYSWHIYNSFAEADADLDGSGGSTILDGGPYSGTSTATLTVVAQAAQDGKYFKCFVTDSTYPYVSGIIPSHVAKLSVRYSIIYVGHDGADITGSLPPVYDTVKNYIGGTGIPSLPAAYPYTRVGYDFSGWNDTSGNPVSAINPTSRESVTLYADWTITSYTVSFNSNGGSSVASQSIPHGGQALKPADPAKQGYIFTGWYYYDNRKLAHEWNFNNQILGDLTLHAQWKNEQVEYVFITNFDVFTGTENLTATVNASSAKLTGLFLDNVELNPTNYSISEGSTVIMLHDEWLHTLQNGYYDVSAKFTDGEANTTLAVNATSGTGAITGVELNPTYLVLTVGESKSLTATVLPYNASDQSVTWQSNDPGIATVDANGKITGIHTGDTTITVTTKDGGHSATSSVTVTNRSNGSNGDYGNGYYDYGQGSGGLDGNPASLPKTYDETFIVPWIIVSAASLVGLIFMLTRKKAWRVRKGQNE